LRGGANEEEDETQDRRGAEAEIALEAMRKQSTATELAQRYEVHANQTCAGKKQRLVNAARAFDAGVDRDAAGEREREIEKLRQERSAHS